MTDTAVSGEAQTAKNKRRRIPLWVFLIRWWSAGALYFFIGWGTGLGHRESAADLVFFLGMSIGLFNSFIVSPALKMLFNYGWHKPYGESTFAQRMAVRGMEISLSLLTAFLVFALYNGINLTAIRVFGLSDDHVFLPGEPILYGLFFAVIFMVTAGLIRLTAGLFKRGKK